MLGSYVTSAIRALQRDPWHAAVNIAGLAIALAASLLIALYVRHEVSYENFITEPERVFRVETEMGAPGRPLGRFVLTAYQVAEALEADLDGQVTVTRLVRSEGVVDTDRGRSRRPIHVGDERLFEVLDLPVALGDAAAAMAEPGAVLLSRRAARQLFGEEAASEQTLGQVLGRTLRINGADVHVAAILEDPPANTDRPVDILGSIATPALDVPPWQVEAWGVPVAETFVRLEGAAQAATIAATLPDVVARHMPSRFNFDLALGLRPLRELHFVQGSSVIASNANVITMGALVSTGAFLIFIACFSYVNLATARSLLRLKEVGLRKIMGGRASGLALQFLVESALVTSVAFVLAVAAAAAALPVFGNLVGRSLELGDLARPGQLAAAAGLFAFVALAAGAYPALALASRKPVDLVRAKRSNGGKLLRTGIVSLQFGLTSALMIAATVAFAQLAHLRNLELGFEKSGLLVIPVALDQVVDGRDQVLRERLEASPAFAGVTWSQGAPGSAYGDMVPLARPGDEPGAETLVMDLSVEPQFFDVYRVELLAGRLFSDDLALDRGAWPSPDQPTVRSNVILSESALPLLGFRSPGEAVGQELTASIPNGRVDYTVVGVVSDIHFRLGRAARDPIAFLPQLLAGGIPGEITARVRPGAAAEAVAQAQAVWSELYPDEALSFEFLEDRISRINALDDRQSKLFGFFAGLALFVACLGLFALASFVAARRAFEVAVRKVLGASTLGVTRLLMWDFAKPVLLANVIAWPLAYVLVSPWLARFPYRIELSPAYFLGVSALSLLVAMITVVARTWKTARTRPALVLRTE
jgi:putative ABC transport system permease protein